MVRREQKLEWVQALRGIAALMVVLVHSRGALQGSAVGHWIADRVLLPMGMGVDLFFIISGFLMVFTTRDFDGTLAYAWRFAAKRLARIWPLFAVVSVLAIPVEHHGIHGLLSWPVLWPYLEGLAFIPHDPAASGIYFHMAVGVAWTLCFECYFYLVFALCMLAGRWRYWTMAAWFALTLIAIPMLRGGYNLGVASQPLVEWSRYANLVIHPIVWDFVFGMLAGWLYLDRFTIRSTAAIYSIVTISAAMLLLGWHRMGMVNFFGPHGWGAPLAIVFFGLVLLAKKSDIRVPGGLVWLGEISYSLYLIHVYVFELVQRIVMRMPLHADIYGMVLFVLRPVLAVLCAWLVFRYVEAPASAWARNCLLRFRLPLGFGRSASLFKRGTLAE
jgi:peptidoglycan/LPS O-acetylase OafA/YrhL